MNSFLAKLTAKWQEDKFVCVGLDPDSSKIPHNNSITKFNQSIIDNTHDFVCAYKFQSAFYEAAGIDGITALKESVEYIRENYPEIPAILDAKRGDIGNSNEAYVKAIFDDLGVDAVTVSPYLGQQSLKPFLERTDKEILVLVKTSNPGAGEFQDLIVGERKKPLYQVVAEHVAKEWNTNNNLAVVVGATYPRELAEVRKIVGDMPILIPGIGAQGGDLKAILENGLDSKKQGLIINSSRGIIFAPNPREAALQLHQNIISSLLWKRKP